MGAYIKIQIVRLEDRGDIDRAGNPFEVIRFGPVQFQLSELCDNPQSVLPIDIDLPQPTEGRAGNILKLFFVVYKVTTAVPIEPVLGGQPQVARTVLGHTDHTALGQPVLHPQVLKGKLLVILSISNETKKPNQGYGRSDLQYRVIQFNRSQDRAIRSFTWTPLNRKSPDLGYGEVSRLFQFAQNHWTWAPFFSMEGHNLSSSTHGQWIWEPVYGLKSTFTNCFFPPLLAWNGIPCSFSSYRGMETITGSRASPWSMIFS